MSVIALHSIARVIVVSNLAAVNLTIVDVVY